MSSKLQSSSELSGPDLRELACLTEYCRLENQIDPLKMTVVIGVTNVDVTRTAVWQGADCSPEQVSSIYRDAEKLIQSISPLAYTQ